MRAWPGRRFWLWSIGIAEAVGFSLIALDLTDGDQGIGYILFIIAVYWLLLTMAVAVVVATARLVKRRARRVV